MFLLLENILNSRLDYKILILIETKMVKIDTLYLTKLRLKKHTLWGGTVHTYTAHIRELPPPPPPSPRKNPFKTASFVIV